MILHRITIDGFSVNRNILIDFRSSHYSDAMYGVDNQANGRVYDRTYLLTNDDCSHHCSSGLQPSERLISVLRRYTANSLFVYGFSRGNCVSVRRHTTC